MKGHLKYIFMHLLLNKITNYKPYFLHFLVFRNPEDHRWRLGAGIQEPLTMDPKTEDLKRAKQYMVNYKGSK